MSHINDLIGVMKGLRCVVEASFKLQQESNKIIWNNSSIRQVVQACPTNVLTVLKPPTADFPKELYERALVVAHGFRKYALMNIPNFNVEEKREEMDPQMSEEIDELNREFNKTFESLKRAESSLETMQSNVCPSIDVLQNEAGKLENQTKLPPFPVEPAMEKPMIEPLPPLRPEVATLHPTAVPKPVAKKKIRVSTLCKGKLLVSAGHVRDAEELRTKQGQSSIFQARIIRQTSVTLTPYKMLLELSENSKARVVPSSRIGRMISFGTLAAGLGVGTVAQYTRNTIQSALGKSDDSGSSFMSPANAERIVDTLCKVRGAALKLGQLLSIQDDTLISPELQKIFERVRQSADFMPAWQVESVMTSQLGPDWRSKVQHFEDKPFAAASIGQVHLATLHNGTEVAMKVQYPGVAKGIDSDIDNLVGVLKVWNVFPKGMFIDNIVEVAKSELAWEVDYVREAECTRRFKNMLAPYPEYFVPSVIDELCAPEVMTTELIDGVPLDKMFDASYEVKHDIAYKIMQLCLREMFVLRCMQTDPNWANFFYNPSTKQVILLDFGATRVYSKEFMDQYIEIIKAASESDRAAILRKSREMKFLTGYETKIMEETHVDTVMIMGEVFTGDGTGEFDFGAQQTTKKIQALVPTILNHRLCPPPVEIYSLHRKLSGVFLLCSKMKVRINCRQIFRDIYNQYKKESRKCD